MMPLSSPLVLLLKAVSAYTQCVQARLPAECVTRACKNKLVRLMMDALLLVHGWWGMCMYSERLCVQAAAAHWMPCMCQSVFHNTCSLRTVVSRMHLQRLLLPKRRQINC
jgi:hypothetical protein